MLDYECLNLRSLMAPPLEPTPLNIKKLDALKEVMFTRLKKGEIKRIVIDGVRFDLEPNQELREALQIVIGHSNCYCPKCNELTKHWCPSKVNQKEILDENSK